MNAGTRTARGDRIERRWRHVATPFLNAFEPSPHRRFPDEPRLFVCLRVIPEWVPLRQPPSPRTSVAGDLPLISPGSFVPWGLVRRTASQSSTRVLRRMSDWRCPRGLAPMTPPGWPSFRCSRFLRSAASRSLLVIRECSPLLQAAVFPGKARARSKHSPRANSLHTPSASFRAAATITFFFGLR